MDSGLNLTNNQAQLDYNVAKLNTLVAVMDFQAHKEESQGDGQPEEEKSSQEEIASQLADFDKQWQADHLDFEVTKDTLVQSESDEEIRQKYLDAVNNYNDALFDDPTDEPQESKESTEEAIQPATTTPE